MIKDKKAVTRMLRKLFLDLVNPQVLALLWVFVSSI